MSKKRVITAMSGGVDSSVAAALLKEADYEVIGVTMQIWPSEKQAFGGCCGLNAVEDAKKVASKLGISHYVLNFRDIFTKRVIADFYQEYSLGRTPNPCIRCNQYIKFDALLGKTKELGADFLATGHYARVEQSSNGYRLLKGVDQSKDQSYFLYVLGQYELQHLLMPIGNLHKIEVRRIAAKLNLPTAAKNDSQDICFIPDNDYRAFIAKSVPPKPGEIVDITGKILGKHEGLAQYTVGQRQGLGLASSERLYVTKLDALSNRLIVGNEEQLWSDTLFASNLNWVSGEPPPDPTNITAKVRYRSPEVSAALHLNNGMARVQFSQPQRAVAPGQAIVFYQDDIVLGGGIIENEEYTKDTVLL